MNTRAAAALLLMICVAPTADLAAQDPPSAPDWSATFTAEAMKAHQRDQSNHMVVVGNAEAREAAGALVAGLRAAGAPLVMDSAALGDTTNVEDQAILTKSAPLPVARVWIVRVYPGALPGEQSAVILVYANDDGRLLYAVQALPGEALEPPPAAASTTSSGVSANARDAVRGDLKSREDTPRALPDQPTARDLMTPEQRYNNERLVVSEDGESTRTGAGVRLLRREFYEQAGRPDLAASTQRRTALRVLAGTAALTTAIFGAVTLLDPVLSSEQCPPLESLCQSRQDAFETYHYRLGGGMIAASVGLLALTIWIDGDTADAATRRKLADERNARLREELGISAPADPPAPPAEPAPKTSLELLPTPSGVALRLSF